MSTSSPQPSQTPGALEEASSPKSRVRITVLTILALHVVVIGGLLLQGCDKRPTRASGPTNSVGSLPPLNTDTNFYGGYPGDAGAGGVRPMAGTGAGGGGGAGAAAPADSGPIPPVGLPSTPGGLAPSTAVPAAGAGPLAGGTGVGASGGASSGVGGGSTASALPPAGSQPFAPIATPPPAAGPAAPTSEHTIKAGENIGLLAKKYHVTEKAIFEANPQVKPRSLKIGDKLIIPAAAPSTATASAAPAVGGEPATAGRSGTTASAGGEEVYIVKQGDTLAKIAKKFGVTVKALRSANGLKGDRIVAKQRLTIPAKAPAASAAAPAGGAPRPGGA